MNEGSEEMETPRTQGKFLDGKKAIAEAAEAAQKQQQLVELAKKRCREVIERIEGWTTTTTKITACCKRTLVKLALSELTFLSSSRSSSVASNRLPLSFNIGHIEAVVHLVQQPFITGVSRVCKPIPLPDNNNNNDVHVDIVCTLHRKPVWIIVSDRNPKYITWNSSTSPHHHRKTKGLKSRIEQLTAAARSAVALKPSSIILFFSKRQGLSSILCDQLKHEFGATHFPLNFPNSEFDFDFDLAEQAGDWTTVLVSATYTDACAFEIKVDNDARRDIVFTPEFHVKDSCLGEAAETDQDLSVSVPEEHTEFYHAFCSLISGMEFYSFDVHQLEPAKLDSLLGESELINFDTTALIAIVSGISNGGTEKLLATPESELRQRFKGNYEFVIGQVMSEIHNPILAELGLTISGKGGLICQSVRSEFKELVLMCGGPNEKLRASYLLNFLTVVSDCPSERMMSLPTSRKLVVKNKVVFGTGDYWCAPTLTANMAFVRAISQTGMSLFTIAHRPRALTGD